MKIPSKHTFYLVMAILSVVTVLVGFGPTYYLRTSPPVRPLTPLIEVHGVVFTSWMLLYLLQTWLAATGKIQRHRKLGFAGGILACLLVGFGYVTAIAAARRGHNPAQFRDALGFLAVPIVDLVVFVALIGPALYWRGRPETHRRLMLLATLSLLGAAWTRMFSADQAALGLAGYVLMVLVCPLYDYLALRRVHPAFKWGTLLVVGTVPLRAAMAASDTWHEFAGWLTK